MASQVGGLIRDQNLNVQYKGASAGDKSNVAKAPKKGGLGRRKPLGDLSNSVKPTPDQTLKKQDSNNFSEKVIGAPKSKITIDGSKKKSLSKVPEKLLTSGRKPLSDISNSGKPNLHGASQKNLNTKLKVMAEEDLTDIAGEGFLHDHQQCIKQQTKSMDIDEILKIVGLDRWLMKQSPPPQSSKPMPASPSSDLELVEEIPLGLLEDPSWKYDQLSDLGSSPPRSPNHCMEWMDYEDFNIKLKESP